MDILKLLKDSKSSDFSIRNLPFGIVEENGTRYVASRLGDYVIDIRSFVNLMGGMEDFNHIDDKVFHNDYLNDFIALGKSVTVPLRKAIQAKIEELRFSESIFKMIFSHIDQVKVCMPLKIGDYTDFYSSIEHATNVGKMFRDPNNPLLPNWLHMPIGYHGRASSIVLSGTDVHRPSGQFQVNEGEAPQFGPSRNLDIELEMAFVIGKENPLGQPIPIDKAEDYIFGMLTFNDWSARDIQRWEYVPLGPFLGKNFASTISPWVVTLEALEPFRVQGPEQKTAVLDYLKVEGAKNYDIGLEVDLICPDGAVTTICRSNFKYMYWNMCQQLAHHTVNGCNMRIGDLCASGTISGEAEDSFGSMMELAWKGTKPIKLSNGEERKFLLNGDAIDIRAYNVVDGFRVGFGPCCGKIV
ncbi:MAG: fumarylacetoacetase [Saprospiraceae bacterium]|nr:fumarylacetoacetase [Saprospiraceae bacterium]